MSRGTIAVVSPGDMGHVIGSVIVEKGYRVITFLEGRSDETRIRAERAHMEDVASLENLISEAEYILSIMPPGNALDFAGEVAKIMRHVGAAPVFVDCNAVSPATTFEIGLLISIIITVFLEIWPLKTTGSFFTTWNATFFWLNISILLAFSKDKSHWAST